MNTRIRKVVVGGVFSALIIVLGLTGLDFIPLPIAAIATLQIPVIIAAILEGPLVGFFTGLLFGVFSLIKAGMAGFGPVDVAILQNPWIAIVPRILIGPAAWLVYSLIRRFRETPAVLLGAVTGSLVNTVLVLSALYLMVPELRALIVTVAAINGTIEAGFSAAIALAVILPWKGISGKRKSRLNR
jgi:uncharacterized membrane protein